MSRPDDRRAEGTQHRQGSDRLADILIADIAEDPADQDEVGRDRTDVGIGRPGIGADDLDPGRRVRGRPCGELSIEFDQAAVDIDRRG